MPVFRSPPLVALLLGIVACRPAAPAGRDSARGLTRADVVRDDFGTTIDVGAPAARIVSLNPTTTELLFAIGASARLVGRSTYDTFPDSARLVTDVGPALRPNVEAVLAVHPDLVLLYASEDNRGAYDRLRAAGVRTLALRIDSIEQFQRDTRLLGRLSGDSARAAQAVDSVTATLARVRAATAALPHPTVFVHAWDKPIIAIGGGSFMSELLTIAGATNVYRDMSGPSGPVTLEDVVRRNPDLILASAATARTMRASGKWRAVPAVRGNHFVVYDLDLVTRPSIQLGEAAVALANAVHPGAVR